jgi:hypothetical protein
MSIRPIHFPKWTRNICSTSPPASATTSTMDHIHSSAWTPDLETLAVPRRPGVELRGDPWGGSCALLWLCLQASWTIPGSVSQFGIIYHAMPVRFLVWKRGWPHPMFSAANIYMTLREHYARLINVFPVTPKPKLRSYKWRINIELGSEQ